MSTISTGKRTTAGLVANNSADKTIVRPKQKDKLTEKRNMQISSVSQTCLFLHCQVNQVYTKFLIDTGSPVSLISLETFDKLKLESKLNRIDSIFTTANGNKLNAKGKCSIDINIGSCTIKQELIVADIKGSSGILGMDFLNENEIDIQIKSQSLRINDQNIPLYKEISSQCARIQINRKVSIPPYSEIIIEGHQMEQIRNNVGIVEPLDWVKTRGIIVAKSLVDTENKIYLSVMNLSSKPVKLKQGIDIVNLTVIDNIYCDSYQDLVKHAKRKQVN